MAIKPIVVSYSELDAYRQCGHKHDLAYRQRWETTKLSPALDKGQQWHLIMAAHYSALQAGATERARLRAVAEILAEVVDRDPALADLLEWMYAGYVEMWGLDPQWEIVAVENQRLVRLPTRTGRASRFYLRMRADLVVRERVSLQTLGRSPQAGKGFGRTKLWLIDHKSGKDLPTDKELDIDDQFGLYTFGLRSLGDLVFGAVYNAARTQRNVSKAQPLEERFARKRLYRTDRELFNTAVNAYITAREAYGYKTGEAPLSPDPDRCRWRCPFTEPCLHGRKTSAEQERIFLAAGFKQLTEAEQLVQRGYEAPLQPPGR